MNDRPRAGVMDLITTAEPLVHTPWWQQWAVLAGAVVLLAAAITVLALRQINARDPAEVAFGVLSRRLNISRRQRRELRALATRRATAPVALLLTGERQARADVTEVRSTHSARS